MRRPAARESLPGGLRGTPWRLSSFRCPARPAEPSVLLRIFVEFFQELDKAARYGLAGDLVVIGAQPTADGPLDRAIHGALLARITCPPPRSDIHRAALLLFLLHDRFALRSDGGGISLTGSPALQMCRTLKGSHRGTIPLPSRLDVFRDGFSSLGGQARSIGWH